MIATAVEPRNDAVATIVARANDGYLRIYAGKRKLLAELRFQAKAFEKPKDGSAKSHPLIPEINAPETGKATRYIVLQSDGETVVWDGDVSEQGKGGSLELDSVNIQMGAQVSISSVIYSLPA